VAVTGDTPVLSVAMAMGIPGHDPGGTGAPMAARLESLGHGGALAATSEERRVAEQGSSRRAPYH
jgi:hypothetical protein